MIGIRIFGTTPPCAKCKRAEREAQEAAEEFPGEVEVVKLDALGPEAEAFEVMVTPTIVIDDQIIGMGTIVRAERIAAHIRRILEE